MARRAKVEEGAAGEDTMLGGQASALPAHRDVVRDPTISTLAGPKALRRDPLTYLGLDEEKVYYRFDALLQLASSITVSGELPEQGLLE